MYTFLKAEWKTIVTLIIFCGAIFTWFYIDEIRKEELKTKPYEYECLKSGEGLLSYQLGTHLNALQSQITDFKRTEDKPLNIVRYEQPDGAIALNFRQDILVSIEFYPQKTDEIEACASDAAEWQNTQKLIAEPIKAIQYQDFIYEGMVMVMESSSFSSENPELTLHGWVIVPK